MYSNFFVALYGLRKSPKLLLKLLSGTLKEFGLYLVPVPPYVYTYNKGILVFFFVYDIALVIVNKLTKRFEFRVLGELDWFLEVKISRDRENRKLWLTQQKTYIVKICQQFGCEGAGRKVNVPLAGDKLIKNNQQAKDSEIKLYQKMVGSLIYASAVTRPDISRAVSQSPC